MYRIQVYDQNYNMVYENEFYNNFWKEKFKWIKDSYHFPGYKIYLKVYNIQGNLVDWQYYEVGELI